MLGTGRVVKDGLPFQGTKLFLPSSEVQQKAFQWCHEAMLAGHPGVRKTINLLQQRFWWPSLRKDTKEWVLKCAVCACVETDHTGIKGLLQPLPTPNAPWKHISMDFVVGLPNDKGYTVILVVVDSLTKLGHFIPCKQLPTASGLAHILLSTIIKLHGIPDTIVSDRGTQFTARFWQSWCVALGISSSLSTSFHPQTDGQTERLNQTLKQYLRCYALKASESWTDLLWLAELTYNNALHMSTGFSPFYATYGYHPRLLPISIPSVVENVPDLHQHVRELRNIGKMVAVQLERAKTQYKKYADKHRKQGPSYQPGEKVLLSTRNIYFRAKSMFHPKYIGPFTVLRQVNPVAYKLQLPNNIKLHPVFHTSLLKPAPNTRYKKPPPLQVQGQEEYEVQRILDAKRRGRHLWYLVSWKGYGPENDSWEPVENVHAPRLVKNFHLRFPNKPGPERGSGGR